MQGGQAGELLASLIAKGGFPDILV